jgi:PIN domain nuclease of toxin-antitoxin system
MAGYVLDTHACLFALAQPKKLGKRARAALGRVDRGREQAWVPAAVVAEIVLLRELGRTQVGLPELKSVFQDAASVQFLPLDLEQLDIFSSLASIRDPFDRLIVSATRALDARLVSKDGSLADSGLVEVVWS